MPLDIDQILRETFIARAEHLPSVGSTNDRAAEIAAQEGGKLPLLVVADRQTAGRGRGANRWWTGPGALAFSLLVDARSVNAEHGPTPLVALASAVAVAETVATLLPEHRIGIHWPNDVMAADRKLAGILIEALPDRRHIVGIGLNTNNTMADAPAELRETAATLRDLGGREYDQTAILIALLNHLEREFNRLCRNPEQVVRRANAMCLQQGRLLTLQWGDRTITGRCLRIADDGSLELETPEGLKTFYSGTILSSS